MKITSNSFMTILTFDKESPAWIAHRALDAAGYRVSYPCWGDLGCEIRITSLDTQAIAATVAAAQVAPAK